MNTFGRGGLSEYSPVANVLRLTRQGYEAAIKRHGQICRWLGGDKCVCMDDGGRPDPNCTYCQGDGWQYRHRTQKLKSDVKAFPLALNAFEVRDRSVAPITSLVSVSVGTPATVPIVNGRTLLVDGVPSGRPILATFWESRIIPGKTYRAEVFGGEYLQVLESPADLTSVISVTNLTTGVVYAVSEVLFNWVHIQTPGVTIQPTDVIQVVADIVLPAVFLIAKQTQNKVNLEWLQTVGGDAMCTYPDEYSIGEGDVISVLSANVSRKQVRSRSTLPYDRIPEWFVQTVSGVRDNSGRSYVVGTDFILVGNNRLLWLTVNQPSPGANYEIDMDYSPTYRVLQQLPQTRSAESQALPGSVALKLFQAAGSTKEVTV